MAGWSTTTGGVLFQFHTGSIKSVGVDFIKDKESLFQFHTGSIKRLYETINILYTILVCRVKSIFKIAFFRMRLPSTSDCANSLGG